MNEGLIPRRYAKALYKFALEKGAAKSLYATMATMAKSFEGNPGLAAVMANPFVDNARKADLLTTAAGVKPGEEPAFDDFIRLLAKNGRLAYARQCALAYLEIYRLENRIYPVDIVSAKPLDENERRRIEALIARHLPDATLEMHYGVDPGLIGGFTVTVGSERLDASIANELKQLRLALLS